MSDLNKFMQSHRRWRGLIEDMPLSPDLYLARQLAWQRGNSRNSGVASASYPEPDNLTAAAAFEQLPQDVIPKEGLIYKDIRTGLWVIVVAIKLIPLDKIQTWCDMMYGAGACALWYNPRAVAPRKQLTWNEQEIDVRSHDKISHVDRLVDQGFKIYTMPKEDAIEVTSSGQVNIGYIQKGPKKVTVTKQYARGKTYVDPDYQIRADNLRCMAVMTPIGAFNSVTEAAMAMQRSPSYVSVRVASHQPGWYRLSREEYKLLTKDV